MPAQVKKTAYTAILATLLLPIGVAGAASDPTGVWFNDTGRGAIEIKPCGGALCGHVVWVKDTSDTKGCGRQIIGNAAKVGASTWDNGWIYSPENKKKYDVELKPLSNGTLQVTGYMGSKLFSKTMIWKRAPADLVRCGSQEVIAKADPQAKPEAKAKPAAKADATAKPETKPAGKDKTATAKAEPKIIPPAPVPAKRPESKSETPAPVEVARAEPEPPTPSSKPANEAQSSVATPAPGSDKEPVPEVHALPGVENEDEAPAVNAPSEEEVDEGPRKEFDMGKIAKRLAELERETGYGLKKSGDGNCRLKVPYATINFPCKE